MRRHIWRLPGGEPIEESFVYKQWGALGRSMSEYIVFAIGSCLIPRIRLATILELGGVAMDRS